MVQSAPIPAEGECGPVIVRQPAGCRLLFRSVAAAGNLRRIVERPRVSNYFLFRSLSAGRDEDEVDAEGHLRLIDRPVLAHVEAINVAA